MTSPLNRYSSFINKLLTGSSFLLRLEVVKGKKCEWMAQGLRERNNKKIIIPLNVDVHTPPGTT
jgi:hypothetical protein